MNGTQTSGHQASPYAAQWSRFRACSRYGFVALVAAVLSVAAIVYLGSSLYR